MNATQNRTHQLSSRSTLRARCAGAARFQTGRETGGHAEITDVGLGGVSMTSEMGLGVGTHVLLELGSPNGDGSAELKGKVVWQCDAGEQFRMGVKVFEDDDTARLVLGDWLHAALKTQSGLAGLHGRQRVLVDLTLAARDTAGQPSLWQRLRPTGNMSGVRTATAAF